MRKASVLANLIIIPGSVDDAEISIPVSISI